MLQVNPKQNQIISTAQSLFWKYGMRRVSIEEICRDARVSKMTFYKFFKNKVDLVKFILDKIMDESMKASSIGPGARTWGHRRAP